MLLVMRMVFGGLIHTDSLDGPSGTGIGFCKVAFSVLVVCI